MKQKIRRMVFETNSSSAHSLTVSHNMCYDDSLRPNENNVIVIHRGEFDWGVSRHNDAFTKASYLFTDSPSDSRIELIIKVIKEVTLCDDVEIVGEGYVDHESCGTSNDVSDDDIKDFIFNKNSWLFLSNDNGGSEGIIDFHNPPTYNEDGTYQDYFNYELRAKLPDGIELLAYTNSLDNGYYADEDVEVTVKTCFTGMVLKRNGNVYNTIDRVDDKLIYLVDSKFDSEVRAMARKLYDKDGDKSIWDIKNELRSDNIAKYSVMIPYTCTKLEKPLPYDEAFLGTRQISKNGNCTIDLNLKNGTRVITYDGDKMLPEYPFNVDIRVSSKCSFGASNTRPAKCSFCHESARVDGTDCNYDKLYNLIVEQLPFTTELAIGCNEITDEFENFVHNLQVLGYQVNLTINQGHIDQMFFKLKYALNTPLGVSYRKFANVKEENLRSILTRPTTVLHVIAGIDDVDDVLAMRQHGAHTLLILGEKDFGFNEGNVDLNSANHKAWRRRLLEIVNSFKTVSFDNLALEQLQVKRIMSKEAYEVFNNEEHSIYINAVDETFSPNSRSNAKTPWREVSIKDYYSTQKMNM